MFNGLTLGIGCGDALATGQTYGIMDYDKDNKESQHSRNRCVPGFTASGTLCAAERAVGHYTEDNECWLNIFKLNGLQAVEHGMSTGTRGGKDNVPDLDTCNGVFLCEDRLPQALREKCGQPRSDLPQEHPPGEFARHARRVTAVGKIAMLQELCLSPVWHSLVGPQRE